jgi:hypothetical protein
MDSWCVVDDETIDITPYVDEMNIIKTDMKNGLTVEDANRIITILNKVDVHNEI